MDQKEFKKGKQWMWWDHFLAANVMIVVVQALFFETDPAALRVYVAILGGVVVVVMNRATSWRRFTCETIEKFEEEFSAARSIVDEHNRTRARGDVEKESQL